MVENLKEKAAKGILWKFIDQGGTQLIQFISGIYIARILSPEDYGLVGMMAIFIGFSQLFIDSGFRTTLIQRGNKITNVDYTVVFYFNIAMSLVLYLFLFAGAPALSGFFNEPRFISVARILGLNLIINAASIVHLVILEKKLNFRTITKIRLVSVLISVIIGITLAIYEFGVWSLVVMAVSESLFRTTLLWIINRWLPLYQFNLIAFKSLFSTSFKLLFNGMVGQLNMNIYSFVIGRYFTTADVGYYSQGRKLQQRIGDFITYSFQGVMLPVQSLIKDDKERIKKSVRKNITLLSLIAFPAIVGFAVIADPFIHLLLTDKWQPSVYYIHVLSIGGIFFVLGAAVGSYIVPTGRINFLVNYSITSLMVLIVIVSMCIIFKLDLKILIIGKACHDFFNLAYLKYFSQKHIGYKTTEFILDILPATLTSAAMGAIIYMLQYFFGISFMILSIQVLLGAILYIFLNHIFNRNITMESFQFITKSITFPINKNSQY